MLSQDGIKTWADWARRHFEDLMRQGMKSIQAFEATQDYLEQQLDAGDWIDDILLVSGVEPSAYR